MKVKNPLTTIVLLLLFGLLSIGIFTAQIITPSTQNTPLCLTDELSELYPHQQIKMAKLDSNWTKHWQNNPRPDLSKSPPYTIPTVFHIIHQEGNENLSEEQIQTALDRLNAAFSNQGRYQHAGGTDTRISFCLARRTPDNQVSIGIERILHPLTEMNLDNDDKALKNLSRYAPKEYMNIWVVDKIRSTTFGDGVTGYATLPSQHALNHDGIVIEAGALRQELGAWVLIHEAGHYLGLYHTFRRGCNNSDCTINGDLICDTPPDNSTAGIPCEATMNTCDTDTDSGFSYDANDATNNHMDYGNLECFNSFTEGQIERMHFFLEGIRTSIMNSGGCLLPCDNPVTVDFTQLTSPIYANEIVNFSNHSTNAATYEWLLDGQLFSRDADLETLFFNTGTFELTLVAYSGSPDNCKEQRKTITIEVECGVEASFTTSNMEPLPGDYVGFTNESSHANRYEWYVNGELVSTEEDFGQSFNEVGEYRVVLKAFSDACEDSFSFIFGVKIPAPATPVNPGLGLPIWSTNTDNSLYKLNFQDHTNGFQDFANNINLSQYLKVSNVGVGFDACGEPAFNILQTLSGQDNQRETQFHLLLPDQTLIPIDTITTISNNNLLDHKAYVIPVPDQHQAWYFIYNFAPSHHSNLVKLYYSKIKKQGTQFTVEQRHQPLLASIDNKEIEFTPIKTIIPHPSQENIFQLFILGHANNIPGGAIARFEINSEAITFTHSAIFVENTTISSFLYFYDVVANHAGTEIAVLHNNALPNQKASISFYNALNLSKKRTILPQDFLIEPSGITGRLTYTETVETIGADEELPLKHLSYFSSNISNLEYSPNGKYLYVVGANHWAIEEMAHPSFVGQINLEASPVTVRLQYGTHSGIFFNEDNQQYEGCDLTDEACRDNLNPIIQVENAFDGNLYLFSPSSDSLLVFPNPNTLLAQYLIPHPLDFSTPEYPNIFTPTSTPISSQIDGYNYLDYTEVSFLLTRTNCERECQIGGQIYLQLHGENIDSFDLNQCPQLVSYCLNNQISYDLYDPQSGILYEGAFSNGQVNYPFVYDRFNFLDFTGCGEICDNEFDDDGDGLIDCFDEDCCGATGCQEFYAQNCADEEGCFYELNNRTAGMNVGFKEEVSMNLPTNINLNASAVVGDLDGDGHNEIVIPSVHQVSNNFYKDLMVFNTTTNPYTYTFIETPAIEQEQTIAIADLDRNGRGEIIIHTNLLSSNENYGADGSNLLDKIVAYEVNDAGDYELKWASTTPISNIEESPTNNCQNTTLGVADFNQDGIAEVYSGANVVFKTANGWQPVLNLLNPLLSDDLCSSTNALTSIAADVLPVSPDCPECAGLELIIAHQVIAFDFDVHTEELKNYKIFSLSSFDNGNTAIADLDLDGDLDAIICSHTPSSTNAARHALIYWDIQNPLESDIHFFNSSSATAGCVPLVGRLDLSNRLSVQLVYGNKRQYLNYREGWDLIHESTLPNNFSKRSSLLFDFKQGDTRKEVILKTSRNNFTGFTIMDPDNSGVSLIEPNALNTSQDANNFPVIIDIDRDYETEILIHYDNQLKVLRPADDYVLPLARPVWNQYNWHNTHINDDLTVPLYQQGHHLLAPEQDLNSYRSVYGKDRFPAADVTIEILSADCISPIEKKGEMRVKICNQGAVDFPANSSIVTRWQYQHESGNWLNATNSGPAQIVILEMPIPVGECIEQSFSISTTELQNNLLYDFKIRLLVGVNMMKNWGMFPIEYDIASGVSTLDFLRVRRADLYIPECNFDNNTALINLNTLHQLDLPNDTLVCANQGVTFNAGSGFIDYLWSDGSRDSIFTAPGKGVYEIAATDSCGFVQTETITVRDLPETVLDLGDTLISCDDAPIIVNAEDFVKTQWFPKDYLSCDTCVQVTITPEEEIEYIIVGETAMGCYSLDTLQILLAQSDTTTIDTVLCANNTYTYEGEVLPPDNSYEFIYTNTRGCDSTVLINVIKSNQEAYLEDIVLRTCQGTTITVEDTLLNIGDTLIYRSLTNAGCDSILTYSVEALDTFYTQENITLCAGDSSLIFNNWENVAGTFVQTFTATNGCDSTYLVQLDFLETINIILESTPPCPNENNGSITAIVSGGLPPYQYAWSNTITDVKQITELSAGDYSLSITDANNCTQVATTNLNFFANMAFTINVQDISCFGASDGSIEISSDRADLELSLDGENFLPLTTFNNLTAGDYTLFIRDKNSCTGEQYFSITAPQELVVELPTEEKIQLGDSLQLSPISNSNRALTYEWFPLEGLSCTNCAMPTALPLKTTLYTLQVTDEEGCTASAEMMIYVDNNVPVYLPTGFSPNEDGINDHWQIFPSNGVQQVLSVQVFNRWGSLVFEVIEPDLQTLQEGWDGKINGQTAPTGVYVYAVHLAFISGEQEVLKGDFLLMR